MTATEPRMAGGVADSPTIRYEPRTWRIEFPPRRELLNACCRGGSYEVL
jgi:hypothetical protein